MSNLTSRDHEVGSAWGRQAGLCITVELRPHHVEEQELAHCCPRQD